MTDPTGAAIPSSTVTLAGGGAPQTVTANATGAYSFSKIAAGTYTITASAQGFSKSQPKQVIVKGDRPVTVVIKLDLPNVAQQVTVSDEGTTLDTSADNNASAIEIKGKALDALSDDPDELSSELTALAGPAAGPNGGQIYIDGFSGGQLPPKASIREIRVNQSPFSAQYDKLGYGRVEILTKPGTDKFHGSVMMMGNDSPFNSQNPFVTNEPPYYTLFTSANAGGAAETFDVIVLGGGAAGLMCAIEAGKRGRRVAVLERADRIGKKILISGGGRCNFTNLDCRPENFLSANPHFCKSALARYTPADFIALIEKHRIPYHEKTLGHYSAIGRRRMSSRCSPRSARRRGPRSSRKRSRAHSSASIVTTSCATRSQNSCPKVFS